MKNRTNESSVPGVRALRVGAALVAALGLASAPVTAHEGHRHEVKGTVESTAPDPFALRTPEGELKRFEVGPETRCRRAEEAVGCDGIAVGERAVVTYETKGGADRALEIRLPAKKG